MSLLLRDSWTEAWRHLIAIPRSPDLVIFTLLQPVMFVILFVYVFGGSLVVPGYDNYRQYLVPGIFAQTVLWGTAFTSVGVAEDMAQGFIERLRSLPIHGASVLIGRSISDFVRNIVTFAVMIAMAFLVGFRFEGSFAASLLATALLFGFAYAFSWVQAFVGLSVRSVEAANSAGYVWMFPLTFISSAFVDPRNMPSWLRPIAEANPFTLLTDAARALYNGRDPGSNVWQAVLWSVAITVVFAALSIRKFESASK